VQLTKMKGAVIEKDMANQMGPDLNIVIIMNPYQKQAADMIPTKKETIVTENNMMEVMPMIKW